MTGCNPFCLKLLLGGSCKNILVCDVGEVAGSWIVGLSTARDKLSIDDGFPVHKISCTLLINPGTWHISHDIARPGAMQYHSNHDVLQLELLHLNSELLGTCTICGRDKILL